MNIPLIVSFFTKDTIYEKEVEDLIASCSALELEHYIEPREDLGSWQKNCCQKPIFIWECLERFQRPILWVDADAIILKPPLICMPEVDLAFYFNEAATKIVRSGTIYAAPTLAARRFLTLWHESCLSTYERLKDLPYGDQGQLPNLLLAEKAVRVASLPVQYVQIFDRDLVPLEEAVILHSQASRTAKMDPIFWRNLSGRDLKKMRIGSKI